MEGKRKADTKNNRNAKASTRAKNNFNVKAYERLYSFVKAGEKEKIEKAAMVAGQSLNGYIVTAIYQRMEKEGWK